MTNPNDREDPVGMFVPAPDRNQRRAAEVRERLEQMIERLRAEGHEPEEISSILADHVAGAMERVPVLSKRQMPSPGLGVLSAGTVLVNLATVPLRFSVSAVMVLYHLQSGGSQPARLGEAVGISPAAMSGILETLEGKRLITRVRDADDRRKIQVELSEEGRRMVASMFLN